MYVRNTNLLLKNGRTNCFLKIFLDFKLFFFQVKLSSILFYAKKNINKISSLPEGFHFEKMKEYFLKRKCFK